MALEIVRGNIKNPIAVNALITLLRQTPTTGTLYLGYPLIASADNTYTIEGMLVSPAYGLVAFVFPNIDADDGAITDTQDQVYYLLEGNLKKHEGLRRGRELAVRPIVLAFCPGRAELGGNAEVFRDAEEFSIALGKHAPPDTHVFEHLNAAIQRVTTIKPRKKRDGVVKSASKGGVIKKIEAEIANLDQWQKRAAIEVANGPQRIRGLAGSGKTVVLALKAAYLHTQNPDWIIWVTFHTRSLNQQLTDLIERFTLEHSGDKPDWRRLRVLHSWGAFASPGVYSEVADCLGVTPHNWTSAKARYGSQNAFDGVCTEILAGIKASPIEPFVDAVLVDEAQDLPASFFKILYEITRPPKRIVWAYDELQNLTSRQMPNVSELFGVDEAGNPRIAIHNQEGEPQRDITLPICYRNTPWALALAHALGLGVYRDPGGLVQFFDDPRLLKDVGYVEEEGTLEFGRTVVIKRNESSSPTYFSSLLDPQDAVQHMVFESREDQYAWVAEQILHNIRDEELDPDDILVVLPNSITAKQDFSELEGFIEAKGLRFHLAGVSTDRDTFSITDSVIGASIFRAKGNEAPMVYVVNAEWCTRGHEMISLRNTLFTAITRSRAWVRITGVGNDMATLSREIQAVINQKFRLKFRVPTEQELQKMRTIHRDRSPAEKEKILQAKRKIRELSDLIAGGVITPDALPELAALLSLVQKESNPEDH